jgi:hypothetical protein
MSRKPRVEIDAASTAELRARIEQAQKWAGQHGMRDKMREWQKLKESHRFGEEEQEQLREIARVLRDDEEPQDQGPKPKRNKGGRPSDLSDEQIAEGTRYLREHPELTFKVACPLLRARLRTTASDSTLRRLIWSQRDG